MHRILGSRTVLAVRDLEESTRFYTDVLGFRLDFGDGSDSWSFLSRDSFSAMLGECPDERPATELGDHSYVAYLWVEGLDHLYNQFTARGTIAISAPADEPWGQREFTLQTPDGHRLRFGEALVPTE